MFSKTKKPTPPIKSMRAVMRVVRIKFAALAFTAFLVLCSIYLLIPPKIETRSLDDIQKDFQYQKQTCHHPHLEPYNHLINKHIKNLGELSCKREANWLDTDKGYVKINPVAVKAHGKFSCKLTFFHRIDDYSTVISKRVMFLSEDKPLKLDTDFFKVYCTTHGGKRNWKNIMAGISRNESVVQELKKLSPPANSMKLNVLMFGLDSMSRMHYLRKLPKTCRYLKNVLNATILKGYNIVGDGTPQALIPILTSFTEQELPETRKRFSNAHYVNVYPFAWNNFSASGYATAYGEDGPSSGTFTYRLKGFKELPTNHYMRSFYLESDNLHKEHSAYCFGSTPRHRVMLNYLREFYDVYYDVPKFAFLFHSELSHDDYNLIGFADTDMELFLKNLHKDGILNNTMLIVMSDHGHRFANIRETQQGKQEERLPFFSIALPPWFEKLYPNHMRNLRTNGDRLTSPFDIYSTLMAILNPDVPMKGQITSRSISLFTEIPKERSCADADIEPHWCACLAWSMLSSSDPMVLKTGQAVVDFINNLTQPQRDVCMSLSVDLVTRAERLQPNKAFLKFKKNADKDGFVGDFTGHTQLSEVVYQVQLRTFPNLGLYEASIKYNTLNGAFSMRELDISRINVYGNQEHCIHDTFPQLRKYCYCKIQL